MSALSRLLKPLPASRRSYSSFFSSKPGGGRYFNSAKPPKSAVVGSKNNAKGEPSESSKDGVQAGANKANVQSSLRSSSDVHSSSPKPATTAESDSSSLLSHSYTNMRPPHLLLSHPVLKPKDFKLHQFFSLYRPLLLISNPPSIFQPAPSESTIIQSAAEVQASMQQRTTSFDGTAEVSADADAEAARQLTRALTMHQAGAAAAWEDTLRRLGLDVDRDPERISLRQQWDKEWDNIRMDSTKRKRRKKMKKHK